MQLTIKSLPKLLAKAQAVFNAWIRKRDANCGCISCGKPIEHAGHYLAQGSHSALRFDEINTNGQCEHCNCFLGGNVAAYRIGLIKKVGEEKVLILENSHCRFKKWDRQELEAIIEKYTN